MAIGIPYAFAEIDDDGRLVRICPVCAARCVEVTDADGEQTTYSYQTHYAETHEESA